MSAKATLEYDGQHHQLPVVVGTWGDEALDITKLRQRAGVTMLDPGYGNTASCKSAITFIDGARGTLHYRGYPIEDLAASRTFLEVAHLLIRGQLPTPDQLEGFEQELAEVARIPEGLDAWLRTLPRDADPTAMLAAGFAALPLYSARDDDGDAAARRLLAQSKALIARWYRHSQRQEPIESRRDLPWLRDFLNMMFAPPDGAYGGSGILHDTLNMLLILHADHEQNCSASTARMVGSSGASLYAAVSAAVGALSGPRHGGANLAVVDMLEELAASGGNPEPLLQDVKRGRRRLMGFGHRVYETYDPRARIIKGRAHDLLRELGSDDPLLGLAVELEHIALDDEYFQQRSLYPNVDFYSGLIYRAMGVPKAMYPVMFALGRLPGWIAHFSELRSEAKYKIHRPRQLYVGPSEREMP